MSVPTAKWHFTAALTTLRSFLSESVGAPKIVTCDAHILSMFLSDFISGESHRLRTPVNERVAHGATSCGSLEVGEELFVLEEKVSGFLGR